MAVDGHNSSSWTDVTEDDSPTPIRLPELASCEVIAVLARFLDIGKRRSAQQIQQFCELNYGVNFPLTAKQRVVGREAHPLYHWIVSELGAPHAPRWNFHKYLISSYGQVVGTWPSHVDPLAPEIIRVIEGLLPKSSS